MEKSRVQKLQTWIIHHYEDWCTICGVGKFPISEQEFTRLGKELIQIDFEELTLVLLQCHYYAVQNKVDAWLKTIAELCEEECRRRKATSEGIHPEASTSSH